MVIILERDVEFRYFKIYSTSKPPLWRNIRRKWYPWSVLQQTFAPLLDYTQCPAQDREKPNIEDQYLCLVSSQRAELASSSRPLGCPRWKKLFGKWGTCSNICSGVCFSLDNKGIAEVVLCTIRPSEKATPLCCSPPATGIRATKALQSLEKDSSSTGLWWLLITTLPLLLPPFWDLA